MKNIKTYPQTIITHAGKDGVGDWMIKCYHKQFGWNPPCTWFCDNWFALDDIRAWGNWHKMGVVMRYYDTGIRPNNA